MKTLTTFLMFLMLALVVRSSDLSSPASSFKPTWKGDQHDAPVYTSPNLVPGTNTWVNTNAMPALTNMPGIPATNQWPVTNMPSPVPPQN